MTAENRDGVIVDLDGGLGGNTPTMDTPPGVSVAGRVDQPGAGRGICEECKANRQRLIGLAADVVGLRRIVGRLEGLDVFEISKRQDVLEYVCWFLAGYILTDAILQARRGRQ